MKHIFVFFFAALFFAPSLHSQTQLAPKKELNAVRILEKINLDGNLDEPAWQNATGATDFLYVWPKPGNASTQKTVVKILYDDNAIYVGAYCYDVRPDSIFHRITKRDELENSDDFSVMIDTYQDGQNAVLFGVSPDNVQLDAKFSIANANAEEGDADGRDNAWDAVWRSAARITPEGWVAEMAIPYSALRFPKRNEQRWSINFFRDIKRQGETDSWNEVKPTINGSLSQMGVLNGVRDIKAPLRLSATPFLAAYDDNHYNQPNGLGSTWQSSATFGMDIKYGINEAFTLDATIVPDFGQVRTDNFVLNLSPFEQRFDENRPFFTEGTELFNKGGLFYSRRIGARPVHFWEVDDQVGEHEEVVKNPAKAQLLNATKISGRTKRGLGIGVFNAVEDATFATINNTETGQKRKVETSPLTNKNVLVLDQNLRNNSSFTLLNTNVMRKGSDPDANVSGLMFSLKNKAQSYTLGGKTVFSTIQSPGKQENGYTASLDLSKISGNLTWNISGSVESEHYNPNDLGFLFSANEQNLNAGINYSRYKPWWKLNNFWLSTWAYTSGLHKPNKWTESMLGFNVGGNTKGLHNFGMSINVAPLGERDYFEPRTYDFVVYYKVPARFNTFFWYNSDRRKRITLHLNGGYRKLAESKRFGSTLFANVRWRATGKLAFGLGIEGEYRNNNVGWIPTDPNAVGYDALQTGDIVLGRRNIQGFDNFLEMDFAFNTKMNLSLFARHYWNQVKYQTFGNLQTDGTLGSTPYTGRDEAEQPLNDIAANYFNIDFVYSWRFAPGSDLLLVYKNGIYHEEYQDTNHRYFYNAGQLPNFEGSNSLSIKVLYYLDYETVRRKLKQKS